MEVDRLSHSLSPIPPELRFDLLDAGQAGVQNVEPWQLGSGLLPISLSSDGDNFCQQADLVESGQLCSTLLHNSIL